MSKHTPGPWSYCGINRGGCICGLVFGGEFAIATTSMCHDEELRGHEPDLDERKANARLIAAAPDLLKALVDLVEINVQHNNACEAVIGRPVGWKDDYLNSAREAIKAAST